MHIEKLNVTFCKYLLGVNKKASNLAVKGELGRYLMYTDIVLSMLNYWIWFHDNKVTIKDKLLLEALKENESMLNEDQSCWLTCIKSILYDIGMPEIFHNPSKCDRKTIKNIQVKLKSRFAQKWQQEVSMVKSDKS